MERNPFAVPTPDAFRRRFLDQDRRLVETAERLATAVRSLPTDPRYAEAEPRALVVGGFVRDIVVGGRPKDLDVEVYGVAPERLEGLLERLFPGLVNPVGKSFGILKIHLGDDVGFDVSIPRRESKTGKGHRGFAVESDPGMTVREAARRRDFTMNAMAADPLTGEIVDPFNGLDDLRSGTLRVTDAERFQDDPLRVYRAVQLAARMRLSVEPESGRLMRDMVSRGDLEELAAERVTEEIKKLLLQAESPSVGFELARELGIIERSYPELHALVGVEQEPDWHPEGDVWTHTLMVVDRAADIARQPERAFTDDERLQILVGALCHDLGKPATTERRDGKIRSPGHEEAGERPARNLCRRWSFSEDVVRAAVAITTNHLKPRILWRELEEGRLTDEQYANALRKLLKRIHPVSWRVLLAASEADFRGRTVPGAGTEPFSAGERMAETIRRHSLDVEPAKPLLQGRDLAALGIPEGPLMGKIIQRIEELRDEGRIRTREEALDEAREILERP